MENLLLQMSPAPATKPPVNNVPSKVSESKTAKQSDDDSNESKSSFSDALDHQIDKQHDSASVLSAALLTVDDSDSVDDEQLVETLDTSDDDDTLLVSGPFPYTMAADDVVEPVVINPIQVDSIVEHVDNVEDDAIATVVDKSVLADNTSKEQRSLKDSGDDFKNTKQDLLQNMKLSNKELDSPKDIEIDEQVDFSTQVKHSSTELKKLFNNSNAKHITGSEIAGKAKIAAGIEQIDTNNQASEFRHMGQHVVIKADAVTTASSVAKPTVNVDTAIHDTSWRDALSERIVWLSSQNIKSASIQLNPRHLGPLEVSIKYHGDNQTSVMFNSHHAIVREALEGSLPRLREMMDEAGVNLQDSNVHDQSSPQYENGSSDNGATSSQSLSENAGNQELEETTMVTQTLQHNGLVDDYA